MNRRRAVSAFYRLLTPLARRALERPDRSSPPAQTPLRVAVVADWLQRYACDQAIGLRQAGAEVTLFYVDRLGEFGGKTAERDAYLASAAAAGVELVQIPARAVPRLIGDTVSVVREFRRRQPHVLVVQMHWDPRIALASLTVPTVFVLHDPKPHSGEEDALPRAGRMIATFAQATATAIMIHSERLRVQMSPSIAHVPVLVVPLGTQVQSVPAPVPSGQMVLLLGRLHVYKGVTVAIEAMPAVRRLRPESELVIAGDGPLAEELKMRVTEGVTLRAGYVPDPEVEQLLERAAVVVLPYLDATQSAVGGQAVGRGIPCVVTNVGGLPDLVPPGDDHLVVPPGDSAKLAEAIVAALDGSAELRQRVFDHAKAQFAWPVVGARLASELTRLVRP